MKNLISTLALAATIVTPAAAFAQTSAPEPNTAAASSAAPQANAQSSPSTVAMVKHQTAAQQAGYGKNADDDREGLARIQMQTHQLGATN
jgi:hypothetical protein